MCSKSCESRNVFNSRIVAYCKTDDFIDDVRQAVRNEIVYKDILKQFDMKSTIKYEIMKTVPNMIDQLLESYSHTKLPSHVAKNLSEQITGFLNNHVQMQSILQNHSTKLNEDLTVSAKNTLDRVTNEDKYHQVTQSHLGNMSNRFDQALQTFQDTFTVKLQSMQNQVNNETQAFKNACEKISDLESQLSYLKWIGSGAVIVFVSCIIMLYTK